MSARLSLLADVFIREARASVRCPLGAGKLPHVGSRLLQTGLQMLWAAEPSGDHVCLCVLEELFDTKTPPPAPKTWPVFPGGQIFGCFEWRALRRRLVSSARQAPCPLACHICARIA